LLPAHTNDGSDPIKAPELFGQCINYQGRGSQCQPDQYGCRTPNNGMARSSSDRFICTKICQPVVRMRLAEYNIQGKDEKKFLEAHPFLRNEDIVANVNAKKYLATYSNVHCNFLKQNNCTTDSGGNVTCTSKKEVSCVQVCRLNDEDPHTSNFSACAACDAKARWEGKICLSLQATYCI